MAIVLKDIKRKTGPNPGGAVNLYVCLADEIESIPAATAGVISDDIVLKDPLTAVGFVKFEFAPGKCKLSHPTVGEDGAKSFETLIDVTIEGDDAERMALFESMLNGRFIAIVDDASKNMKVAGTLRAPLELIQANYDGGDDQPGMRGTIFQFKSRDGFFSKIYEGAIVKGGEE